MTSAQLHHVLIPSGPADTEAQTDYNGGIVPDTSKANRMSSMRPHGEQSTLALGNNLPELHLQSPMWGHLDPGVLHTVRLPPSSNPSWSPWNQQVRPPPANHLPQEFPNQYPYRADPAPGDIPLHVPSNSQLLDTKPLDLQPTVRTTELPRITEDSDSPSDFSLQNRSESDPIEVISDPINRSSIESKEDFLVTPYPTNPFCAKALFLDNQGQRDSLSSWDGRRYDMDQNWVGETNRVMMDLDNIVSKPPNQKCPVGEPRFAATCMPVTTVSEAPPLPTRLSPPAGIHPRNPHGFNARVPVYPFPPHMYRPPYPSYAQLRQINPGRFPSQHGQHGFSYGLDGTRRKNATRESTTTLKVWLQEHIKNPYPTKGEKIMLAIITKMTLTQVSTWFANARRRLKKENKMSWPSKTTPTSTTGRCNTPNDGHSEEEFKSDKASCKGGSEYNNHSEDENDDSVSTVEDDHLEQDEFTSMKDVYIHHSNTGKLHDGSSRFLNPDSSRNIIPESQSRGDSRDPDPFRRISEFANSFSHGSDFSLSRFNPRLSTPDPLKHFNFYPQSQLTPNKTSKSFFESSTTGQLSSLNHHPYSINQSNSHHPNFHCDMQSIGGSSEMNNYLSQTQLYEYDTDCKLVH